MPLRNIFNDIKSQINDFQNKQQHNQPPPVPASTHPNYYQQGPPGQQPLPGGHIYWQPRFSPDEDVAREWECKLGNNGGWGNNEVEQYTAERENVFYTPNTLILRAISQPNHSDPAKKYTSARLVSHARLNRPRGSLSATLTLPCAPGIWPAFWLLPYEPFTWPTDGEIDVAETWNGDGVNHSCLHWGFYTPGDRWKHRVVGTPVRDMARRPVRFEFAWWQDESSKGGRMMWWIDGVSVMRNEIPGDMNREMKDFVVLLNIAMGGNVCAGQLPAEGRYEMVVHEIKMSEEPDGGWGRFEADWGRTREGEMIG